MSNILSDFFYTHLIIFSKTSSLTIFVCFLIQDEKIRFLYPSFSLKKLIH